MLDLAYEEQEKPYLRDSFIIALNNMAFWKNNISYNMRIFLFSFLIYYYFIYNSIQHLYSRKENP